jgi:hypothetical protein
MEKRELLLEVLQNLWTAEWRVGVYDLRISNFRVIPGQIGYRADDEVAGYLLKSCFRVSEFFPGAFRIEVDSIPDLPDDTVIGTHWLTEVWGTGDTDEIEALINTGKFDPGTF